MSGSPSTSVLPLEARGLTKVFSERLWHGRKIRTRALKGLDLAVQRGEAFGLVGPNGSGKSTTIKLALGLVFPSAGEILLNGRPPTDAASREGLGYMPENPSLLGHLGARETLIGAGLLRGLSRKEARRQSTELLDSLGLGAAGDWALQSFSKGMAQRAALAHALMAGPDFLVLDEPLTGLDPIWRHRVVELLMEFREAGGTLLFCSHILADVERLADRIGILHEGQLHAVTTPADLVGGYLTAYAVRTRGTSPPDGMETRKEGADQWAFEVAENGLWPALDRLRGLGHQIIEVRPAGLGLENALMRFLHGIESQEQQG